MNITEVRSEIAKWEQKHPGSIIEYHMYHVGDINPYPKDIWVSRSENIQWSEKFQALTLGVRCETRRTDGSRVLSRAFIFNARELGGPKWPVQRFHAALNKVESDCFMEDAIYEA